MYPPPATPFESDPHAAIATVWRELLGRDRVGHDDNFFDLGGTSLLVIQLQGELLDRLGVDAPLMDLFRFATIRALVDHLSGGDDGGNTAEVASTRGARRRESVRRRQARRGHHT